MIKAYLEIQGSYVRCQTDQMCGNNDSMSVLSGRIDFARLVAIALDERWWDIRGVLYYFFYGGYDE